MKILNRFSEAVIFEDESVSVLSTLYAARKSGADLGGANLRGADLGGANLRDANLRDANLRDANLIDANLIDANLIDANLIDANLRGAKLRGAKLSGAKLITANLSGVDLHGANLEGEVLTKAPVCVLNLKWPVLITEEYMRIGCQRYTIDEWKNFNDDQIKVMASEALEFWRNWKVPLLAICETHCVKSIT